MCCIAGVGLPLHVWFLRVVLIFLWLLQGTFLSCMVDLPFWCSVGQWPRLSCIPLKGGAVLLSSVMAYPTSCLSALSLCDVLTLGSYCSFCFAWPRVLFHYPSLLYLSRVPKKLDFLTSYVAVCPASRGRQIRFGASTLCIFCAQGCVLSIPF